MTILNPFAILRARGGTGLSHSLIVFLAATLAVASGPGWGQGKPPEDNRTRYTIGGAVLLDKDGYRGVGSETMIVPGVSIQNKWVNLFGPQLDLRLIGNDQRTWWIGPRIEYRFDGYDQDDGAVFQGMASRKGGLFYGLSGSVDLGARVELEADYVKAARRDMGFDRGAVASLQFSRSYRAGPWTFSPRIGLEYQSDRYVDYYYGVRLGEATAARPAYAGKGTWSPEFGLLVRWQASPRQFLFANLNYERYAKEIRNSPLINASGIPQAVFGYGFMLN